MPEYEFVIKLRAALDNDNDASEMAMRINEAMTLEATFYEAHQLTTDVQPYRLIEHE